jgi:hypothetical protein
MRQLWAVALAAAAFAVAATVAQAQAPPPSLTGEELLGLVGSGSATCKPNGTSTVNYQTGGAAFGPYSGTFSERGTVSIRGSEIVYLKATFDIDSPIGHVSGTKTLRTNEGPAACINDPPESPGAIKVFSGNATLNYEATITTTEGTFRDRGRTFYGMSGLCTTETECPIGTSETFTSESGVLPPDTRGAATGGGYIVNPIVSNKRVAFGFEVKRSAGSSRLQGRCLVRDSLANTQVRCLDVTSYQQVGNTATWTGHAVVNGIPEEYRITVQDNGEPNRGVDTFSIKTESYETAGNVSQGNVQVHQQN